MLKALFIIGTIAIAVVLASQPIEDNHKHQHIEHKRQHHVAPPSGQHHLLEQNKEQLNHGRVNVPIAPHHSRAHRNNNKRHKSSKASKASKSHHQHHNQPKSTHHKKQSHKAHGHGRKHH